MLGLLPRSRRGISAAVSGEQGGLAVGRDLHRPRRAKWPLPWWDALLPAAQQCHDAGHVLRVLYGGGPGPLCSGSRRGVSLRRNGPEPGVAGEEASAGTSAPTDKAKQLLGGRRVPNARVSLERPFRVGWLGAEPSAENLRG